MIPLSGGQTTRRRQKRKVLKMAQIEYIKHLYECEGKSLREIAKELGLNFRTVQPNRLKVFPWPLAPGLGDASTAGNKNRYRFSLSAV
jgi:hypothetical protein